MLLSFISNDTTRIILWVVLVCAALGLIALMAHTVLTARRNKKNGEQNTTENDEIENSENAALDEEYMDVATSDNVVLSRNVVYSAGFDGQIKAGKYSLQSADESEDKFNLRYNGLVKEYANGDVLTLADGDTLSPVSGAVVLNKAD